jgi:hypothetical protein
LRGEIRQTKKQIKELKKAEVVDEQAVRVLEAKLQVETEKLKIHGERLNQLRTRVARNKGWSKVVGKEGFYRIISKKGRGMYANSNARYVVEAMCLGPKLGEVMSSQSEEVKLTPLVDEIK